MKKSIVLPYLLLISLMFQACKEKDIQQPPVPTSHRALVRKINWTAQGSIAQLSYNNDSTVKTVNYIGTGSSYAVNYLYSQGNIARFELEGPFYSYEFQYDSNVRISGMKRWEQQANRYSEELEFSYNPNGTVSTLKYHQVNEAGRKLLHTHTYNYDAKNQLTEINSMASNGTRSKVTIEGYSTGFSFDPLWFMGISLDDSYMIYNYPLLSTMKGLPTKIVYTDYPNGQPSINRVITVNYTINNKRIERQLTSIRYPQHPAYDTSSETVFTY